MTRAPPVQAFRRGKAARDRASRHDGQFGRVEHIVTSYASPVKQLTLLVPRIVWAILDGMWQDDVAFSWLLSPFPLYWPEQRKGDSHFAGA